tara:strand:- start:2349 stop:2474 length:126 start_codon:yes stop_codon:yes gene_type:complete
MFPLDSAADKTPYRLLSKDLVSTIDVDGMVFSLLLKILKRN